ncbi:uncharacterized protein KIAA1958-like [Ahaetulla prasina]|uniref:uncharacterized protein KIAA1958-like n=1 Tax=Ahaetulla prasina TaxID=499056 RepID=UPI0026472825|nr:uncharacterized protein KIAA1958-like [Ahaetulla prasina]
MAILVHDKRPERLYGHYQVLMTQIPAVKLNELLEDFYVTVKKTDGSDFLATSLHAIRRGLDRILKNAGIGFSITSGSFNSSTKKLKEKLRVLS